MKRIQVLGGLAVLAVGVSVALAQAPANMSFFVTSTNPGKGGDLGALPIAGASRWSRRQDVARLSLDEHGRCKRPHRQWPLAQLEG
jgi:hypothetical protein